MKYQTFGSVFDALCDDPNEAQNLRLRADMMISIIETIKKYASTPSQAANQFGIAESTVNDLFTGKINHFSVEHLMDLKKQVDAST